MGRGRKKLDRSQMSGDEVNRRLLRKRQLQKDALLRKPPEDQEARRRKRAEQQRRRRAKMSEEELEKLRQVNREHAKRERERMKLENPEKYKELLKKKSFDQWVRKAQMTEEEKKRKLMQNYLAKQASLARKDKAELEKMRKVNSAMNKRWRQNLTAEGKARHNESVYRCTRRHYAKGLGISMETAEGMGIGQLTTQYWNMMKIKNPEKWRKRQERLAEKARLNHANMTPEEKRRRLYGMKVATAKRKLKKGLEEQGAAEHVIERRLNEVHERMWKEFDPGWTWEQDQERKKRRGRRKQIKTEQQTYIPEDNTSFQSLEDNAPDYYDESGNLSPAQESSPSPVCAVMFPSTPTTPEREPTPTLRRSRRSGKLSSAVVEEVVEQKYVPEVATSLPDFQDEVDDDVPHSPPPTSPIDSPAPMSPLEFPSVPSSPDPEPKLRRSGRRRIVITTPNLGTIASKPVSQKASRISFQSTEDNVPLTKELPQSSTPTAFTLPPPPSNVSSSNPSPAIVKEEHVQPPQIPTKSSSNFHQCPYCPTQLPTANMLRAHVGGAHPTRAWKCPKCSQVVFSPQELATHFQTAHRGKKANFWCMRCSAGFPERQELFTHVKRMHIVNFWPCKTCNVLKYSSKALKDHCRFCVQPKKITTQKQCK